METKQKSLKNALQEPFPMDDISWLAVATGVNERGIWVLVAPYVKARAIRERLDDVVGAENWKPEKFEPGAAGGVQCGLSLRINGEWITKWDGAENTDIEAIKGGMSDAFKRAAKVWGIGRYLDKVQPAFAEIVQNGKYEAKVKDGDKKRKVKWNPPGLPSFAWPDGGKITHPTPKSEATPPKERTPKTETPHQHSGNQSHGNREPDDREPSDLDLQKKKREVKAAIGQVRGKKLPTNESAFAYFMRKYHEVIEDYTGLVALESSIYYFVRNGALKKAA